MRLLQSDWETKRCTLTEAQEEELEVMASIFSDNSNAVRSQGPDCAPKKLASVLLHHEALPPNGDPSRERTLLIADKESKDTIGLLSLYCGYPTPTTLYIGSLFFKQKWQRRGFGREMMGTVEIRAVEDGYGEARVAVGLKNWLALRFWVGLGHDRVTRITGDDAFSNTACADIELTKRLSCESAARCLETT
jgi:diamine N-acetyltransferase